MKHFQESHPHEFVGQTADWQERNWDYTASFNLFCTTIKFPFRPVSPCRRSSPPPSRNKTSGSPSGPPLWCAPESCSFVAPVAVTPGKHFSAHPAPRLLSSPSAAACIWTRANTCDTLSRVKRGWSSTSSATHQTPAWATSLPRGPVAGGWALKIREPLEE